ncbi:Lrp/AsnC family transcriptional regulator [Enterovirga rhinocerotis]|uniref:AsnC family transcriptional regulator n=1 Tax=Enterovirga rhinocerotis TaxID=1339210 RepID=A0A4R7C516_9HYPH|nr:Lrp/AsnC family transcriptional regulator [Enterovirga rhinocerotis]TDR92952.1 AsnC family transcriptional regulator [Enterovirga rhinocerotis]
MTQDSVGLDRLDRAILRELLRDARISHVALGQRIGLSPTSCARRIKILEDAGIVAGHQAVLDPKRLGLSTTVIVRISLQSQADEALDAFERAIAACSCVARCLLMSGTDDYLVTVLARDIEDFEDIHRRQLSRLPGVARIQSSFAIREVINRPVPPSAVGA